MGLIGGTGLAVLAGCGQSNDAAQSTTTAPTSGGTARGSDSLVQIFPASGYVVSGLEQRMAFALGGSSGVPERAPVDGGLSFTIFELDQSGGSTGTVTGTALATVEVPGHADGVPIAYYPLRYRFERPGYYGVRAVGPGMGPLDANIAVSAPDDIELVQPGDKVPVLNTPTTVDARGIDPICTATPACPLHEIDLADAVVSGKPTALLISTPAFCQIGVCGPVLDLLVEAIGQYPQVQPIHCEVYRDAEGPTSGAIAPVVEAMGMQFEPSLYLIGADGVVRERLDNVFDRTEINAALTRLTQG
ncbi:MAG: hypothetical protein KDB35_17800 [Acidimicrobiales bacterium]|nr:hypothetical protein [Acidimicrobiales bacterium]